jgi:DNA replication initiation complex subunit (GINS family)
MYSELYKAWKSEKTSPSPEPLPKDFYQRVTSYLKSLQEDSLSSDAHSIQGRLVTREREIAGRLLDELRETRLRKILENAKNGISLAGDQLTDEEQTLAKTIGSSLKGFKENQIEKKDAPSPAHIDLAVVRFLQDIREIVGIDLKIYGPYKKEDVGSLPTQNVHALVKQGAVKLIEVKGILQRPENESNPINNK